MKTHTRIRTRGQVDAKTRWTWSVFVVLALVAFAIPLFRARASSPTTGTINVSPPTLVAWDGTAVGTGAANGESSCVENNPHLPGDNCDTFTLTAGGTPADWAAAAKRIEVKLVWANSAN